MHIHCLLHVPFEGIGHIQHWIETGGHRLTSTCLYKSDQLPAANSFDRLLVMGGPMNIHQEELYPWLKKEKRFIEQVIDKGRTVVGICLGAQLVANVLGARVYQGAEKEIGWFPITLTEAGQQARVFKQLPRRLEVFHWHGDTFDLPRGATLLAESEACANQAFLYDDRVLGLQFHLESTPESVEHIISNCRDELIESRFIQTETELRTAGSQTYAAINRAMEIILHQL